MKEEISYREHNQFLYQAVYFCCKIGRFKMGVYGDRLAYGASLKWLKELH